MDSVTVLTRQGSSSRNTLVNTVDGGFFGLQSVVRFLNKTENLLKVNLVAGKK